jgi:lipopolysaccharide biosynthesis regulator YciM
LELAAGKDGPWQYKAMLILSRTYESIGNQDRAVTVLEALLDREPDQIFRRQALRRLMELKQDGKTLLEQATIA